MTTDARTLRPGDFPHRRPMQLRWLDVDRYGHVNNAVHYLLMDTVINDWLAGATGAQPHDMAALGVVVETSCQYLREINVGDPLVLGVRLERLGTSSITYQVGFFIDDGEPAAVARFVHVYIDPASRRPVPVPDDVRAASDTLLG
jgi:acyl-CoA thioester hydrolase